VSLGDVNMLLAEIVTSAANWDSEQQFLTYIVPEEFQTELQVGQLVAAPYGERLVEGIVWALHEESAADDFIVTAAGTQVTLRPLHAILDQKPVLLPHQRQLAQWMAQYYVTPLAQVAFMMLPPGLTQRSQMVLRLATTSLNEQLAQKASPRLRALVGLLLADGTLAMDQLKQMLGEKKAREVVKEAMASGLITREAQLQAPRTRAYIKRVVRLVASDDAIAAWRAQKEAVLQQHATSVEPGVSEAAVFAHAGERASQAAKQSLGPISHKQATSAWGVALAVAPANVTEPTTQDKVVRAIQRQLAAIDLLQYSRHTAGTMQTVYWTPHMLRQASELTLAQLRQLEREHLIVIEEAEVRRDPLRGRVLAPGEPLPLTPDQQHALTAILESQPGQPLLLHGVTGSGKTEVYLQALAAIIAQGKQGIMLVPEIALTTQAVQRVASRFPGRVAMIHSGLNDGERYDEWRRIRSGQVDVVIGSRSALFAPVPNLGLIIVDEEHEPAYKQAERKPTYHAREVAIVLGQILEIPVVLGSATPSVETYYRAEQGVYRLVELPGRIGAALPPVEIVDLRDELHAGNTSIISRRLQEELERVLSHGQQAILFLNRRGTASSVLCRDCGYVALCPQCDIPLTYHATERLLLCHYCGTISKMMHNCPVCQSAGIRYFGLGTEKVQKTLQQHFPTARLLRWDRDMTRVRHAHEDLLERFANREADILIGTQMIAKGLDLPGVTLVGVISADIALTLPDYATTERAFTLLTQVAGRAGRGAQAGHVIIQTFNPQHFCIETAAQHDYHTFYKVEIQTRRRFNYPPFCHFVKFTYSHKQRNKAQNEALLLSERLYDWIHRLELIGTDIVGPAPALMERVGGKYRWQIIARGPDLHRLLRVVDTTDWEVDIDPVSTL
jgi:primosomal protein N' (replication factor Y)